MSKLGTDPQEAVDQKKTYVEKKAEIQSLQSPAFTKEKKRGKSPVSRCATRRASGLSGTKGKSTRATSHISNVQRGKKSYRLIMEEITRQFQMRTRTRKKGLIGPPSWRRKLPLFIPITGGRGQPKRNRVSRPDIKTG